MEKNKYSLDNQLLEQIVQRAQTPNGNEEYNLLFPLILSIYGKVDLIQKNPMVCFGRMLEKHPAIVTIVALGIIALIILAHDPTNFDFIVNWLSGTPALP